VRLTQLKSGKGVKKKEIKKNIWPTIPYVEKFKVSSLHPVTRPQDWIPDVTMCLCKNLFTGSSGFYGQITSICLQSLTDFGVTK